MILASQRQLNYGICTCCPTLSGVQKLIAALLGLNFLSSHLALDNLAILIYNSFLFSLILAQKRKRKLIRVSIKNWFEKCLYVYIHTYIQSWINNHLYFDVYLLPPRLPEHLASKFHLPSPWLAMYLVSKSSSSWVQGPLLISFSSSLEQLMLFEGEDMANHTN